MSTAPIDTEPGEAVLDNAVWESLTGAHVDLAEVMGTVRRYRRSISPFIGMPTTVTTEVWADLARLAGSGAVVPIAGSDVTPPDGWEQVDSIRGVQLVATDAVVGAMDPEAVRLGADDVDDMVALVERTKPGPFAPETYLLGNYVGVRRGGRLIAMAGQRLNPPGWAEISAVCTDAEYRGQGLGSRLVLMVAALIRANGETPFMHAAASNTNAIRLYEGLGFRQRKHTRFSAVRVP